MVNGIVNIETGFNISSLVAFKAIADGMYIPVVENEYLEIVTIPTYNVSDPSHILVSIDGAGTDEAIWNSTTLNSATYKHFYILPDDYSSTRVVLTADGTDLDRRTISLYNANNTHPASLVEAEQANVRVDFNNADYWTLDRLSNIGDTTEASMEFTNGASFNTINRHHMKDYYYGILLFDGCHNNTIQNSYINHCTHAGRISDNCAIALASNGLDGTRVLNTKLINNDIRNAGDGIQLIWSGGLLDVQYNGTIIDSNNIWIDGDVYTNGDYGTNGYNAAGEYMIAENAIDLKAGSDNPLEPVIITNNKMWGYRETDPFFQVGGGSCFPMHYGVLNTNIDNNIFFDTQLIGGASGTGAPSPYSVSDSTFRNNIFYDIGLVNPDARSIYAMFIYNGNDITFDNNTYVNVASSFWHRFETSSGSMSFSNNLMIDVVGGTSGNDGATVDGNYYYNTPNMFPTTGTDHIETVPVMGDYSFQYEKFTTTPKTKDLVGIISSSTSPHYGVAGSNIT